jgi:hypothetical protein
MPPVPVASAPWPPANAPAPVATALVPIAVAPAPLAFAWHPGSDSNNVAALLPEAHPAIAGAPGSPIARIVEEISNPAQRIAHKRPAPN